jgi:N-acetylglucosamine kinase-like BadF-type ATPase
LYLLGIDGGQTSTKACLYNHEAGTYDFASGSSIDHMLTPDGQMKSKQGIQQAIQGLLQNVTTNIESVNMAFISISGVHKEHEELIKSWVLECIKVNNFMIEGDVKANLAGASGGLNDGVLVISGGGSIAYYLNDQKEYVAGGYGHILGDEGSAYWIGIRAIQAAIRSMEKRSVPTILVEKILHYFQETSFWGIKKLIHGEVIQRSDIAKLSLLVEVAANAGDITCQTILKNAGTELGDLAISILHEIQSDHFISTVHKVYPTGGVFQSENWALKSMKDRIANYDSSIQICTPIYPPIIGAILLASQALNIDIKLDELHSSLKGVL